MESSGLLLAKLIQKVIWLGVFFWGPSLAKPVFKTGGSTGRVLDVLST